MPQPEANEQSQIGAALADETDKPATTAANFIMNQNEHNRFVIRQS
jgi:hypothetical protein